MRFMVLIKADTTTEAGVLPDETLLTDMGRYNQELADAGILVAGEGLHPSSRGARVIWSGGRQTVVEGPFTGVKELVAGFWIWEVASTQEAIEWVRRCPNPTGQDAEIEIRQIVDPADFGESLTPGPEHDEQHRDAHAAANE